VSACAAECRARLQIIWMRDASPGDPGNNDVGCSFSVAERTPLDAATAVFVAYLAHYRFSRLRASLIYQKRFLFFLPSPANAKVSEPAVHTLRIIYLCSALFVMCYLCYLSFTPNIIMYAQRRVVYLLVLIW